MGVIGACPGCNCPGGSGDPDYPLLSDIGSSCTPCMDAAQRYLFTVGMGAATGCDACGGFDGIVVEWGGGSSGQCRWYGETDLIACNRFSSPALVPCAGTASMARAQITFTWGPGATTWRAQLTVKEPLGFTFGATYGMDDDNCLSSRTMSILGSGSGCCSWPSTITVGPSL